MKYVLDACALIAVLNIEEDSQAVRHLLLQSLPGGKSHVPHPVDSASETSVYMSPVNLLEVYYDRMRVVGPEQADHILQLIYASPIKIQPVTGLVIREAGRLKNSYDMSLADAVGLATAINLGGVFVTSDGEFKKPEIREHAPVFWFRPPKEKK
jgi:predicted nucleic acid-binding protein